MLECVTHGNASPFYQRGSANSTTIPMHPIQTSSTKKLSTAKHRTSWSAAYVLNELSVFSKTSFFHTPTHGLQNAVPLLNNSRAIWSIPLSQPGQGERNISLVRTSITMVRRP